MLNFLKRVNSTVEQFKSKKVLQEISVDQYLQDRIEEVGFGQYVVLFEYAHPIM